MQENTGQPAQDIPANSPDNDRLDNFLSALFELKYNISHAEKKYPFLGHDLSSLCDETIVRLSCPSVAGTAQVDLGPAALPLPVGPSQVTLSENTPAEIFPAAEIIKQPVIYTALTEHKTSNPVACSLDAAGGFLVTGLDKMGDGIIIAFDKLLFLAIKPKKQPAVTEH